MSKKRKQTSTAELEPLENNDKNNTLNSVLAPLVVMISWASFWFAFFLLKTDISPVTGVLSVTWSVLVIFFLPFCLILIVIAPSPKETGIREYFPQKRTESNDKALITLEQINQKLEKLLEVVQNQGDIEEQEIRQISEEAESLHDIDNQTTSMNMVLISKAVLLWFLYIIVSSIIVQYFSIFGSLSILITLMGIPTLVCIVFRSKLLNTLTWLWHAIYESKHYWTSVCLVIASLVIRFPFLINGETGNDSFLIHSLTNDLLADGTLRWVISPLSLIEWFPASTVPSSIFFIGTATITIGYNVEIAIFFVSVIVGILSTLGFILLLLWLEKHEIINSASVRISAILYTFLPLLLKFTDWTASGRQFFLLVAPFTLILFLHIINGKEPKYNIPSLTHWAIAGAALLLSHGMGRILIVYAILLLLAKWIIDPLMQLSKSLHKSFQRWREKSSTAIEFEKHHDSSVATDSLPGSFGLIGILAMVSLLLPHILFFMGADSLVGNWVLTRSSLTSSWIFNPVNIFLAFFFVLTARLGFVAPLLVLGLILFPVWIKKASHGVLILAAAMIFVFPFFALSPYYYQATSFVMVIIAGCFAEYLIEKIANTIGNRKQVKSTRSTKQRFTKKRVEKVLMWLLVLSCVSSTMLIQGFRYKTENASTDDNLRGITNFLENCSTEPIIIMASNERLARQIEAFSPSNLIFPMSEISYLSKYGVDANYTLQERSFSSSLRGLLDFLRYGPYDLNSESLNELNNIAAEGTLKDIDEIAAHMNVALCREVGDNWTLFNQLSMHARLGLIMQEGNYELWGVHTNVWADAFQNVTHWVALTQSTSFTANQGIANFSITISPHGEAVTLLPEFYDFSGLSIEFRIVGLGPNGIGKFALYNMSQSIYHTPFPSETGVYFYQIPETATRINRVITWIASNSWVQYDYVRIGPLGWWQEFT